MASAICVAAMASKTHATDLVAVTEMTYAGAGTCGRRSASLPAHACHPIELRLQAPAGRQRAATLTHLRAGTSFPLGVERSAHPPSLPFGASSAGSSGRSLARPKYFSFTALLMRVCHPPARLRRRTVDRPTCLARDAVDTVAGSVTPRAGVVVRAARRDRTVTHGRIRSTAALRSADCECACRLRRRSRCIVQAQRAAAQVRRRRWRARSRPPG